MSRRPSPAEDTRRREWLADCLRRATAGSQRDIPGGRDRVWYVLGCLTAEARLDGPELAAMRAVWHGATGGER